MIEIRGLNKYYGRNHVLKDISLEITDPGIYAVLGHNGSGKTTLLKSILGLVLPRSGQVLVNRTPVGETHLYRSDVSYLPQIARFPDNLRVHELINLIKDIRNQEGDEKPLIDIFQLQPEMKKRMGNLSGGTRQKVNMLLGFLFDTPIIILDEPTISLDPVALAKFKSIIAGKRAAGKIILYTTHIMSLVEEFSDRIILLMDGKIIFDGGLKEICTASGRDTLENAIAYLVDHNGNGKVH
jgi:Cu-processing system ATP-binding protein